MVWEWIAAASVASVGLLGYSAYVRRLATAEAIETAPSHEPGPDLRRVLLASPDRKLPYISVQGEIQPIKDCLTCGGQGDQTKCVIKEQTRREHKSVYVKAVQEWQSNVRTINSTSSDVPFALCSKGGSLDDSVTVKTPMEASDLPLIDTRESFQPVSNSSIYSHISDVVTGEKVRGYEEIERALPVGVLLTGVGELSLFDDQMILQRPISGLPYILSAKSKAELAAAERNVAGFWKAFCYVCLFIGGGIALFAVVRFWKKQREEHQQQQREIEFAERQTMLRRAGAEQASGGGGSTCVVCLENAADVILLNCGHLCSCSSCVSLLICCPVCRGSIERYVPVFAS
eukprot:m.3862 g.3862  ORF g.3862 m.3862 type:complete len:345 (+) comp9889_c0_seq1:39-1073(+)